MIQNHIGSSQINITRHAQGAVDRESSQLTLGDIRAARLNGQVALYQGLAEANASRSQVQVASCGNAIAEGQRSTCRHDQVSINTSRTTTKSQGVAVR